ncbi:MAG: cob(I)yrinic acid a,c-diamide adenosyltransferase [Blastocatellia bacterium]|nr:cob(I)yrinic acid a,c-diamide adenosyltransferase [Blastocatellia bacterium]MCS7157185.1 cob(I)yrinic acid a,c-diamide adenosyltransferase [Blastocatellia bacterium]MCX7752352.1 cob(I)yrinic acid a,c-diamide adenosyltransferase [Blastocatellia bacterium]MDW8167233.1 cob(I)yrinic acid a,c-diamide adenosyltransferase [Acidobacteriota bacterium]
MRITKVYTRTGDRGETSLVGGRRVRKDSARVEAYGDVDELNSLLGVVRAHMGDSPVNRLLAEVQNELFTVGADLASPLEIKAPRIEPDHIARLEQAIDEWNSTLPPLREFILPGGAVPGALLHLARTVARRAERRVVRLAAEEPINEHVLVYLNRLSDLLFVLARVVNRELRAMEEEASFGSPRSSTPPSS